MCVCLILKKKKKVHFKHKVTNRQKRRVLPTYKSFLFQSFINILRLFDPNGVPFITFCHKKALTNLYCYIKVKYDNVKVPHLRELFFFSPSPKIERILFISLVSFQEEQLTCHKHKKFGIVIALQDIFICRTVYSHTWLIARHVFF